MPQPVSVTEVSCSHYPPPGAVGNPTYICRGCGCTIADQRHPANQALGFTAATVVARPEAINTPRNPQRRG